jgi:hypothetical protein
VLNTQHTRTSNSPIDTLPRPRASRKPIGDHLTGNLSKGPDRGLTLKLLVALHIVGRKALLSSKALTLWPRSYAPR